MRCSTTLILGLLQAATLALAAPADDHQRGLQAYHRGDVVGALGILRPAARAGHAPAQALLAFLLERADETAEAARWYRLAAEQDDPEGHAGLAALLASGRGVAKDEKAAVLHFSKAAARGHKASAALLAQAYRSGGLGLAPDPEAAARWQAAAQ
jgi:TPR repeat protein